MVPWERRLRDLSQLLNIIPALKAMGVTDPEFTNNR